MVRLAVAALLLALPLVPGGVAQDPLDECFYVAVVDVYLAREGTMYVESNGVPGLQRGGGVTLLGDPAPVCDGHVIPDMMVF